MDILFSNKKKLPIPADESPENYAEAKKPILLLYNSTHTAFLK